MSRPLPALIGILCYVLSQPHPVHASTNEWASTRQMPAKEPVYATTPKYCLLELGNKGDVKVWMVEDGRRLFIDKNANGDLTDDGPPIEPGELRNLDAKKWDFNYKLDALTPTNGSRHTRFDLRRWNYDDPEDRYGLSLSVNDQQPMYAGWFGTFWSAHREQAPVIHFGGPFTPKLLRADKFTLGSGKQRLSLGLFHPGSGPGAESRLSIDALPAYVVPKVTIEWPTAKTGETLRTTHPLAERCCYWEFYNSAFEVPQGAAAGIAHLSIELPAGPVPLELTTTELTVRVVAPAQH